MTRRLSVEELAEETGVGVGSLGRFVDEGLIRPDESGSFAPGDVIRVEALASFLSAGVPLEPIVDAVSRGLFTFEFLDRFHPEPTPKTTQPLEQLAGSLGIESDVMGAIYLAMGLPEPPADYRPTKEEAEILREYAAIWGPSGDDALLRAARLVGEPARLLSEGWTRLYVEKISDPLSGTDMPVAQRIETIVDTTERATNLASTMFQWLLHMHHRRSINRANIEGLEQLMAAQGLDLPLPERLAAIVFVDMSGFTAMTEQRGDVLAATSSEQIRRQSQRVADKHSGSLVKLLGDGAMLHFDDVSDAVPGALELVGALAGEGLPVHAGVHAGPMVERDGDYYGSTVNMASRIADLAGAGQVLVSEAVAARGEPEGLYFTEFASTKVKGIEDEVRLFEAQPIPRGVERWR